MLHCLSLCNVASLFLQCCTGDPKASAPMTLTAHLHPSTYRLPDPQRTHVMWGITKVSAGCPHVTASWLAWLAWCPQVPPAGKNKAAVIGSWSSCAIRSSLCASCRILLSLGFVLVLYIQRTKMLLMQWLLCVISTGFVDLSSTKLHSCLETEVSQ